MGVITSVRRNVKNAGRCSVFVDDDFFAACPIDVALALGLRKGLEMSADLERRLRSEDRRMVLRQKAYRYATYKPRTERDLRRFLDKAEATEEESAGVLAWLAEFRLIDDEGYARRFIEASKLRKPLSPTMMRRSLLAKGLSESVVEAAMASETTPQDSFEAARAVARKKLRMLTPDNDRSTEDKLVRFLQYRGYTWTVIKDVISLWKEGSLLTLILLTACASVMGQHDTSCHKMRLSDVINKFQPATLPVPGPAGEMYFDRKFHPDNPDGGSSDADQAWVTRRRGGSWDSPTLAVVEVFDPQTGRRTGADVVFGFSTDNLRALLAGRFVAGSKNMSLVLAQRATAEGPFLSHQVIMADLGRNFYATFNDDASTFIVSVERPSGKGDLDLYRITYDACGKVSEPVPLADNLNTAAFDGAPWLSCDGRTLYFSSAGREDRRGKADLYVTRRLDDSWTRWSDPINLGACVNTTEDETAVSLGCGASELYFTSWDDSSERMGIYTAALPAYLQPQRMVRSTFTIRDAIGDTLVRGLRIIGHSDADGACAPRRGWPVDDRTRRAVIMLPPNARTTLAIDDNPRWRLIDGEVGTSDSAVSITMQVVALDKPLCSINFENGDTTLSLQGHAALESLRSTFGTGALSRLRVVGYADASGTTQTNLRISQARAQAVAEQATILVPGGEIRNINVQGRGVEVVSGRRAAEDAPDSRRVDVYYDP
jgi:SOS response regulatory protein OraA/RecX/flagellar motor protein MotB